MQILNHDIETEIQRGITANLSRGKYDPAIRHIRDILKVLYDRIPENRRSSFGRVYTIQLLSEYLFSRLVEADADVYEVGTALLNRSEDFGTRSISLGILSFYGIGDYEKVLHTFEVSASSPDWDIRECAQMFFRKLVKKWPDQMKEYLQQLVTSKDPKVRRFVSETLRPVKENKWLCKNPDYSLSILQNLFKESSEYPRTSVGNNLSDLARHHPDIVLSLVEQLVASGDHNSYWIAYRACRNLVKQQPIRVMNVLQVDQYQYKKRVHKRSEYPRDQGKIDPA